MSEDMRLSQSATREVTIYALTDPDSGEVRYVGQSQNVQRRYTAHLMSAEGAVGKHEWLLELQQRQQLPVLKILEEQVCLNQARVRERWWIEYYRSRGALLSNSFLRSKPPHPLRQWRDQHDVSQDELAELAGVGQGMISHIERYFRVPRKSTLIKLQEKTGLPTDAFMFPERFLEQNPDYFQPEDGGRDNRRGGSEPKEK
jgi:hypothetical protein